MSVDQFCSSSLLINSLTNTYLWLLQRLQTLLQMQTLYQKHPLQCWFCWICAYTQLICAGVFIKTWILLQRAWTMFSSWRRLAIFISMHWGRATIAIAHCPTAVSTVSLEYWQICIYPRRVAQWQNRGRSPAHDGQLRSWSHQQFYKTQFIKQFITLQILSKLESKYFDAKYTFCPQKCEKAFYVFCHKLSSRQCNHFDVRCFEKILFAKPKSVITFSTVWFPPINCVKQTKVWQ